MQRNGGLLLFWIALAGVFVLTLVGMASAVPHYAGRPIEPPTPTTKSKNIGFAFSGAGGRLPQEFAMVEALVRGYTPNGQKLRPVIVSGVSAGALTAVMMSAAIQQQETGKGPSWEDCKQVIFNVTDSTIYDSSVWGLARIFTHNIYAGYILDNTPFIKFMQGLINEYGYRTMGDLYIPTIITVVNQTTGEPIRLDSRNPAHRGLSLLDVLTATTSIPPAFPYSTIAGVDGRFVDGGVGTDAVPTIPLLSERNPRIDEIYVIVRQMTGLDLPGWSASIPILYNSIAAISTFIEEAIATSISVAAQSDRPAFLYTPILNTSFGLFDFQHEKLQYDMTHEWATKNNPLALNSDSRFTSTLEVKRLISGVKAKQGAPQQQK